MMPQEVWRRKHGDNSEKKQPYINCIHTICYMYIDGYTVQTTVSVYLASEAYTDTKRLEPYFENVKLGVKIRLLVVSRYNGRFSLHLRVCSREISIRLQTGNESSLRIRSGFLLGRLCRPAYYEVLKLSLPNPSVSSTIPERWNPSESPDNLSLCLFPIKHCMLWKY